MSIDEWHVRDVHAEFDVVGRLGAGAFATVMLARYKSTGQVCAIKKRVKRGVADNRDLNERFWLRIFRCPFVVHM